MAHDKLVTVIIPVYNRREELAACLSSVVGQSYRNFEAIVIDDASTIPIEDVVSGFADSRLLYVRKERNGGPYSARAAGWLAARGEYIVNLDSDWEAFPWLLERVVRCFDEVPEADAVTGMFLRHHDSLQFVRVTNGRRLVSPADIDALPPIPDCIAGVRKCVVEEWLAKSRDYFAFEAHSWLTFSLTRKQLYLDEPWARYHIDAPNRVTPLLAGKNPRQIEDCLLFLQEHDQILRSVPRRDIDRMLIGILSMFLKNGHREGMRRCLDLMRARGIRVGRVLVGKVLATLISRVRRLLPIRAKSPGAVWF